MNITSDMYTPRYLEEGLVLLTQENLMYHSTLCPDINGKADLMEMFHVSLEQENKRRLRRSRRFPTPVRSPVDQGSLSSSYTSSSDPSSSDQSRRHSRRESSSNVAIEAKSMIFPYHNDAIFLPTAESPPPPHFDTVSIRPSISPSLQSRQRRPSSPVWWRKSGSQSPTSVSRLSYKPHDRLHTDTPENPKQKALSKKLSGWCQKTWLRITGE